MEDTDVEEYTFAGHERYLEVHIYQENQQYHARLSA